MLVLGRKSGQSVACNGPVVVTVVAVRGEVVRLGFECTPEVTIRRTEVEYREELEQEKLETRLKNKDKYSSR